MNLSNRNEYWYRLFVAISLLAAAIFGAEMYESGCAAAWRLRHNVGFKGWWARRTISLLDLFEKRHCELAWRAHNAVKRGIRGENDRLYEPKGPDNGSRET